MILLIDADLVAYRAAASANNDPEDIAILRCDKTMRELLEATGSNSYVGFLSGTTNFRKTVNPDYKAHRKDKEPPTHLQACRGYLSTEWNCRVSDGIEADDELGIHQNDKTILCSLDKDLQQIPGKHFNWVSQELTEVTEEQGVKFFWKQMLIGDVADNLRGVDGIGKVKAAKLIDPCETEQEMFEAVWQYYKEEPTRFLVNGICFYILRSNETVWLNHLLKNLTLPDQLRHEAEILYESTKYLTEDI